MRTPGRCTNFDTCWLANGRRDIRVMVGDPFVCPACGEPLHAPSIESISASGIAGALAISLAMVATAGGAGYGLVRLAQTAGTATVASRQAPRTQDVAAARHPAMALAAVQPVGHEPIQANPAEQPQVIRLADSVPALQFDPSIPPVVYVAAAPPHPLVLPINFGRPPAPEDDAPARSARWHHHAFGARHRTYSAPVPVWSEDDEQAMNQAQQGVAPAQGDADESTAQMAVPDQAADDGSAPDAGQDMVPAQQADTSVPAATQVADAHDGAALAPTEITRLVVPAMASLHDIPAYQPAERIDPSAAASADHSQDSAFVLATLPRAKANKLAVPVYPAQLAADERPGRVDVGCVISERGLPSGCQVQHEEGGHSFAHSVMSWLKSGKVRYRPSVVDGQPAAEPRDYQVRFEP